MAHRDPLEQSLPGEGPTRRKLLTGALGLGALATLSACGPGPDTGASSEASNTIRHKYGRTEIPARAERIVSVGYTDQDPILALGVTPVAVREFFGSRPSATWPWAQDELGDARPEVLPQGQLNFERITALRPDLIIGVTSGMNQQEYETLSRIAPTLAQPDEFPDFALPWQHQTRIIGRALGHRARAERLVAELEARFDTASRDHPAFAGVPAIVALPSTQHGQFFVYGPDSPRSRFLTALGFRIPQRIAELPGDVVAGTPISSERLGLLDSGEILMWNLQSPQQRAVVENNAVYQQLTVARRNKDLFLGELANGALSFSTVLSLPTALDILVPQLAEIVARP